MKKTIKTLASVLALVGIFGMLLTGCGGGKDPVNPDDGGSDVSINDAVGVQTFNLTDYIGTEQSGNAEGQGRLSVYIDARKLSTDLSAYTIGLYDTSTVNRTLEGKDNHNIPVFSIVNEKIGYDDGVGMSSGDEGLSNGDVINFKIVVNERGLRLLNAQLKGANIEYDENYSYTVAGLDAAIVDINPFEDERCDIWCDNYGDWSVSFEDRSHDGGSYIGVNFELDLMGKNAEELKNGDQVKITITASDEEMAEYGYRLTQREGIVTIDWLWEPEN